MVDFKGMSEHPTVKTFILGAGGIGCALGHALCAGGAGVTFVDADEQKVDWGRRHGVGLDGRPSRPAEFVHFADWQPQPDGIILLCTKCYDNKTVLDRLPSTTDVIPVQNGFDHDLIEHEVGLAATPRSRRRRVLVRIRGTHGSAGRGDRIRTSGTNADPGTARSLSVGT